MSVLVYCLSFIIVLAISLFIRDYLNSKERLIGNYYKRKPIGFCKPYTMVEVKKGGKYYTRVATEKDLIKLENKERFKGRFKLIKI